MTSDPITLLSAKEQFITWPYRNYNVYDDNLVDLMQNGDIQLQFLNEYGLPEDTYDSVFTYYSTEPQKPL